MIVGGVQWTTLLDYPDRIAATVFAAGCNFRCPFCHNPDLVLPDLVAQTGKPLDEMFFDELGRRRGFLDALVISGGEPTLQPDLLEILDRAKQMGLLTKLDTNGTAPDVIRDALTRGLLDFIAMDIKAPREKYVLLAGAPVDHRVIEQSVSIIIASDVQAEFRTTVAPGLTQDDLHQIANWIGGTQAYWLQEFQVPACKHLVDDRWRDKPALSASALHSVWQQLREQFRGGGVRT